MKAGKAMWAVKTAGAGALALLMAVPLFADTRGDQRRNDGGRSQTYQRNDGRDGGYDRGGSYRENQRVSASGRVTSFTRDRDGYRVQLDRGRSSYWVPQSYFRNRGRDLRVGIQVVLGGIFRGGSVYVDSVNWPDAGRYRDGYRNDYVSGIVERVDFRSGLAIVRDDRSGRSIEVDFRTTDRRDRLGFEDVRRGDYIELSGSWRGRIFDAYSIDGIRDRR